MSVTLRLKRFGRTHRPFYRLGAMDSRSARDSNPIEELGYFNPVEKDQTKQISFNTDRVKYWLSVGAQPSDTVRSLLKRINVDTGPAKKVHKLGARTTAARAKKAALAAAAPAEKKA